MPAFSEFATDTVCPYCGKVNQCASNTTGTSAPDDGCVSFCIDCGKVGVFESTAPGGIRKATIPEMVRFSTDPHMARLSWAWSVMRKSRPLKGSP